MAKQGLLNEKQNRVRLLENNIIIDKNLPKYRILEKVNEIDNKNDNFINNNLLLSTPDEANTNVTSLSYETLHEYFIEKSDNNVTDFNLNISEKMRDIINKTSFNGNRWIGQSNPLAFGQSSNRERDTLFNAIKNWFKRNKKNKEEKKTNDKFDVVKFFSDVKSLSEEESNKYRDRITDYVNCIGYTEQTGQIALKEKLFEKLVINKYESILYSKGLYKALSEELLVKLAKNSPKALSLDYIANFVRTIPLDVIKKKIEADKLEVFDNYVILHYDPEGISYASTNKEKEKEVRKAKDPILFGVISGSDKLYYIDDWVDEYCDLTFDKCIEQLGKDVIKKSYINEKI